MCIYTVFQHPCGHQQWRRQSICYPTTTSSELKGNTVGRNGASGGISYRSLGSSMPILDHVGQTMYFLRRSPRAFLCKERVIDNIERFTNDNRCRRCGPPNYHGAIYVLKCGMPYSLLPSPVYVRKVMDSDFPLPKIRVPCTFADCLLDYSHNLPHVVDNAYAMCQEENCILVEGHSLPHKGPLVVSTSRSIATQSGNLLRQSKMAESQLIVELVVKTLESQSHFKPYSNNHQYSSPSGTKPQYDLEPSAQPSHGASGLGRTISLNHLTTTTPCSLGVTYEPLNTRCRQVRLFQLLPRATSDKVEGMFRYVDLASAPLYKALSYSWGDPNMTHEITLQGCGQFKIRANLYDFLRLQSRTIRYPQNFWIDALCINQENVHERNHQVSLMKDIYANAEEVLVWLGKESEDSNTAMSYVSEQSTNSMRERGQGFHNIWTKEQGKALSDLCQRPYWRRMWIIQEILYARKLSVWCGSKCFDWADVGKLYLKLKVLEDTNWFTHHPFVVDVIQSPAAVMVWQRAHWRHPETPPPSLRTLVEIFRQWQCADVRDKVFALTSMASDSTTIVPDYAMSSCEVYKEVCKVHEDEPESFQHMLSQVLALSTKDLENAATRTLLDYRTHAADHMVMKRRMDETW